MILPLVGLPLALMAGNTLVVLRGRARGQPVGRRWRLGLWSLVVAGVVDVVWVVGLIPVIALSTVWMTPGNPGPVAGLVLATVAVVLMLGPPGLAVVLRAVGLLALAWGFVGLSRIEADG